MPFEKGHKINVGKKYTLGKHWKVKDTSKMSLSKIGKKFSEEHKNSLKKNHSHCWLGKKHTEESRLKMKENVKRGEAHPMWKGGVTPINRKLRKSIEFRLWREAVFARDNWTCQECNKRGGELHPHHIKRFAYYPELRFAIDNGQTLCKECHKKPSRH
jgi:5-methylcytosine-specific restriction endonuclease McrA